MVELTELREEYQISNLEIIGEERFGVAWWGNERPAWYHPAISRAGAEWRFRQPYAGTFIEWPLPAAWQLWLDNGGRWELVDTATGWLLKYLPAQPAREAGWVSRNG